MTPFLNLFHFIKAISVLGGNIVGRKRLHKSTYLLWNKLEKQDSPDLLLSFEMREYGIYSPVVDLLLLETQKEEYLSLTKMGGKYVFSVTEDGMVFLKDMEARYTECRTLARKYSDIDMGFIEKTKGASVPSLVIDSSAHYLVEFGETPAGAVEIARERMEGIKRGGR